jgi:solute:Na+ symporter, SSS family
MFSTNFTTLDWWIVVLYLSIAVVIGVVANRFTHSVSNYMVGGRSVGAALNAASYMGTLSALSVVMYSGLDGFARGFSYLIIPLIAMTCVAAMGITGFVVKNLRLLNLTTIPEYFEVRYSRRVRIVAGTICATAGIINMGLFPKVGAIFIANATGLGSSGEDAEFLVNTITSALIVLVLFYTIMGGMVSVILTDFMQYIVISVGILIAMYFTFALPGISWDSMVATQLEARGEAAFDPFHEDSYGWTYMIWQLALLGTAVIAWAPEAGRMLTARDYQATMRTFLLGSPAWIVGWGLPAVWAIAAFAHFSSDAELSAYFLPDGPGGAVQHGLEALPLFLGKVIPAGMLGIFTAGMLAAFMSTHDSYFLSWASVIVRDVINPLRGEPLADAAQIRVTRIIILITGVFLLIWGVWYELPDSIWTYMAVTGNIFLSGAGVVIVGGLYWPRASTAGAMAAMLVGLISVVGLFPGPVQAVAPWMTEGLIGVSSYVLCAIAFFSVSLLFPDSRVDNRVDTTSEQES